MPRYVAPFSAGTKQNRTDAGVDVQGVPGTSVNALGSGRVTFAGATDPGGYGYMVVYKLDHPPDAQHQFIFIGHASPLVHQGQRLTAGQAVSQLVQRSGGDAAHLAGWAEMGWAAGPGPTPLSATHGHYHANTPEGHHFVAWLIKLGFLSKDYGADTQGQDYPIPSAGTSAVGVSTAPPAPAAYQAPPGTPAQATPQPGAPATHTDISALLSQAPDLPGAGLPGTTALAPGGDDMFPMLSKVKSEWATIAGQTFASPEAQQIAATIGVQ